MGAVAEPLYDPEVNAWLDTLADTNPALLTRIEDQIDLLRAEPIPPTARRRQFRTRDGGFCYVIPFEFERHSWLLVWVQTPSGEAAIVGINPTDTL